VKNPVPPLPARRGDLYRRLFGFVRPYWRRFALGVLGMVVYAVTETALPALLKELLDGSFVAKDPRSIQLMPLAIVGLFLVRGVSDYAHTVALAGVSQRTVADVRKRLFAKLLTLPTGYFDAHTAAATVSKLSHNASQIGPILTSALITVVRDTLTVLGLLAYMLYLNWQLSLVFFTVLPLIAWVIRNVSRRLRGLSRSQQQMQGAMNHVVHEAIGAHREIRVFGGQEHEARRYAEVVDKLRRNAMKVVSTSAANGPLVQGIAVMALAAIIYYAAMQTRQNELTVGGFVSFFGAMALLLAPLKRLSNVNEVLQRGLAGAASVFELLDTPSEPDAGTTPLARAQGRLRFDGVRLRYPRAEREALAGVDLEVRPGETVALVGASGSGKTTLMALIPRFYAPDAGVVSLDGIDLRELRLADLRAQIALVTQHTVLFNDTVAANIAYGSAHEPSEAEVIAAAEAAHAMEFIRLLPEGLQTLVGENGARLSGGQRQRLAIARALLKDAPILLLDEATSALDTESERAVQAAIENLKRGRTTLIIAHRLSTIVNADRIVVMEHGRIAESGTHAQLIARGGIYQRLHRLQFSDAA
jgi:subfamily B ATP-binding cassette protein MsbA